ncbi:MAG: alpha/beta hydrolase [Actinomycetota bacterium]|nr:alpha/beta hydrolase [Actinomycetota bacterium]
MTEQLFVDLPTHRAAALAWGPPDGRLVLALHGYPDTAWTWRHLGPDLAAHGYRVVAPFMRGYAPSGVPADRCFHPAALMADAVSLHRALGGQDQALLVGHDWGAIATNALGAHPDSPFERIVSMAVPPFPALGPGGPRVLARQARMSWYVGFNQLPFVPERALPRMVAKLWRDWSPSYDGSDDVRLVLDALAEPANRSAALGYYRSMVRPVPERYRTWKRTWTAMPAIPFLYLHGDEDGCMQVQLADQLRRHLPTGSRFEVIGGAGHFLQVEQPERVNALVREFLQHP